MSRANAGTLLPRRINRRRRISFAANDHSRRNLETCFLVETSSIKGLGVRTSLLRPLDRYASSLLVGRATTRRLFPKKTTGCASKGGQNVLSRRSRRRSRHPLRSFTLVVRFAATSLAVQIVCLQDDREVEILAWLRWKSIGTGMFFFAFG